jgi:hypothetical protein
LIVADRASPSTKHVVVHHHIYAGGNFIGDFAAARAVAREGYVFTAIAIEVLPVGVVYPDVIYRAADAVADSHARHGRARVRLDNAESL